MNVTNVLKMIAGSYRMIPIELNLVRILNRFPDA